MSLLFFIFIPVGFIIDYLSWKRLTPCMVAFIGVYLILLSYESFGSVLGFIEINEYVYFYILLFYLVGLISSLSAASLNLLFYKVKNPIEFPSLFPYGKVSKNTIISVTLLMCLICIINIYAAYSELGSFVSEDFEGKLTYGFAGHSFALLMATLPFLTEIYLKEKSKRILSLILLVFCLLFLKQVKYWVMIPLVWMVWYVITGKYIRLSLGRYFSISFKLVFLLLSLFFLVYFMKVVMSNQTGVIDYTTVVFSILIHFFGYLFSGILTFSSYLNLGLFNNIAYHDALGLMAGFLNIFNAASGGDLITLDLVRPMVSLNTIYPVSGNVPSLWGTTLLAVGNYAFVYFFFMIFLLSILCSLSQYSKVLLLLYTFITSFLFFSWFDYYYYLLTPYEVTAYIVILYSLVRTLKRKTIRLTSSEIMK